MVRFFILVVLALNSFFLGISNAWANAMPAQASSQNAHDLNVDNMPSDKAGFSTASQPLIPLSVLFNWHHQYEYGGFYAAQMLGLYRQAGLKVTLHDWQGEDIVQSVVSGRYDIGVDSSMIISDYLKGVPIRLLFANLQYSPLVLLSHQSVENLSELAGKKIMLVHNYEVFNLLHRAGVHLTQLKNSARLADFIQKKTDLYSAYETNEPFQLKEQGIPFYLIDPKDYGVESYGDLVFTRATLAHQQPEALEAFKRATLQGWQYALNHPQQVVNYIAEHYPLYKSRHSLMQEALATKEYVQPFTEAQIGEISRYKLLQIAEDMQKMQMVPAHATEQYPLENLVFKWDQMGAFTPKERAYLAQHPVLKLGNDRDWAPFEFIDAQGHYQGMAADFMKLISQKLQVSFEPNRTKDWEETLELTYQGKMDFLSAVAKTPERLQHLNFTTPYLDFPMVLAGRDELDYIPSFTLLKGQVVAVTKGYASEDYLHRYYPSIKVLPMSNVHQGLHTVLEGKAVGYLGNLAAINYAIRNDHLTGLKIVANTGQNFQLAMGVPKDNRILFSILQKALHQITPNEREEILDRWLPLKMVTEVDNRKVWHVMAVATGIVSVLLLGILYLLSLKKRQKQAMERINELSHAATFDANTLQLLETSESYAQMVGLPKESIIGKSVLSFQKPLISKEKLQKILETLKAGQSWSGELQVENPSGEQRWVEVNYVPQKDHLGQVKTIYTTRRDITAEKENERLSQHDALTSLYNRRKFNDTLPIELKRAHREKLPLVFIMIDIDFFKKLNDQYGHQQGDGALKKVAEVLMKAFSRSNDFVFRMGGEEFGVITYEAPEHLPQHLADLQEAIKQAAIPNIQSGKSGLLTLSMGAVILPTDRLWGMDQVFQVADKALYQAKEAGRDRYVIIDLRQEQVAEEKPKD